MTRDPRDTLNRVLHDAGLVENRKARRLLRRYERHAEGREGHADPCPCGGEVPVCHEVRLEIGDLMLDPARPCRCRNCGHTQACHERAWRDRLLTE